MDYCDHDGSFELCNSVSHLESSLQRSLIIRLARVCLVTNVNITVYGFQRRDQEPKIKWDRPK